MLKHTSLASLIADLRGEALEARTCYRTMSLQVLMFSVGALGAVLAVSESVPIAGLAAVGVMLLVMAVERMGIHKFSTANRHYGYQLHLERMSEDEVKRLGMGIGWEEACRAWRIVQATVFTSLYRTPDGGMPMWLSDLHPGYYTPKVPIPRRSDEATPHAQTLSDHELARFWWLQDDRARERGAAYHAGSYLARIFSILGLLQVLCLSTLLVITLRTTSVGNAPWFWMQQIPLTMTIAAVIGTAVIVLHRKSLKRRRRLLEHELLSIHSCAIMWRAVVLAHFCAWNCPVSMRHLYTERLARVAAWFACEPKCVRLIGSCVTIPDWLATTAPSCPTDRELFNRWLAGLDAKASSPRQPRRRPRAK